MARHTVGHQCGLSHAASRSSGVASWCRIDSRVLCGEGEWWAVVAVLECAEASL